MEEQEIRLIVLAQTSKDDCTANQAMKDLRDKFDKTYGWCWDCDFVVVKEKDCCLNIKPE